MTDWEKIDDDLTTPTFFAGTDFHATFATLRREDPVHWTKGNYERGFWSLTRHTDVLRLLDEPELFSIRNGPHLPPEAKEFTGEQLRAMGMDVGIASTDPPRHHSRRIPMNPHFSVPAVRRLRGEVENISEEIFREVAPRGEADIVEDLAAQLPVRLFLPMMGIPKADWRFVRNLTVALLHPEDPEFKRKGEDATQTMVDAQQELYAYMYEHVGRRRADPQDDFTSLIANMKVDGEPLGQREATWYCLTVVQGGLETTRNAAAMGMYELIRDPRQAQLLREDSTVATTAVEEIIRWVTPSKNRARTATADTDMFGKPMKKGDWVVGWAVSANRDETVFGSTADRFDITRTPNKHLGFGDGVHLCLGRNVARLELEVLIRRFAEVITDAELLGEPDWVVSDNTTGFKRLNIRFTPKALQAV
ncbi:cytochrome P450 [Actinomadura sp. LOL_016]|uniref:cytochrome P450 n=1 Tax=unclassified Actinomadura TaxID=2626254 RepID=UPI003A811A9C